LLGRSEDSGGSSKEIKMLDDIRVSFIEDILLRRSERIALKSVRIHIFAHIISLGSDSLDGVKQFTGKIHDHNEFLGC
jgi:hypothetical protein